MSISNRKCFNRFQHYYYYYYCPMPSPSHVSPSCLLYTIVFIILKLKNEKFIILMFYVYSDGKDDGLCCMTMANSHIQWMIM